MCKDCSFSQPISPRMLIDNEQRIASFSWVDEKEIDNDETESRCSCCDVSLSSKLYRVNREYEEENDEIVVNKEYDEENGVVVEHQMVPCVDEYQGVQRSAEEEDFLRFSPSFRYEKIRSDEDDIVDAIGTAEKDEIIKVDASSSPIKGREVLQFPEDAMNSLSNLPLLLENWSDYDDHWLVTIASVDSVTSKNGDLFSLTEIDNEQDGNLEELNSESQIHKQVDSVVNELIASPIEFMNNGESENTSVMVSEECNTESIPLLSDQVPLTQAVSLNDDTVDTIEVVMKDSDEATECEDGTSEMLDGETESKTLIGGEMSDKELTDQPQANDIVYSFSCLHDNFSSNYNAAQNTTSSNIFMTEDDQSVQKVVETIEGKTTSVERTEECMDDHLSKYSEVNIVEENNSTKTSNHVEGLEHLQKKLQLLEKKESGMEESLDGSFISEISSEEGILIIEHLKSMLKEQNRARCALYAELEEERSANAIAAKQTMEMITRLQEEKAAIQMEALQYQRMMEEQSEYDQEALQLLNELVVKAEKEKQELQMELEIHHKKILHYELKERRITKRKTTSERNKIHYASFSNSEVSDQLSVDFDHESVDEDSSNGHQESNHNTPADAVLNMEDMDLESSKQMSILDESLADFEAEKLSILEKLKALEEKLFELSDDEEGEFFEDIKPVVQFSEENTEVFKENQDFNSQEVNGNGNGICKHFKEKRNTSPKAKGLLPLFDAVGMENLDVLTYQEQSNFVFPQKSSSFSKFMAVNKRLAIEEEVDCVYERLQALEADREFLKQSISSLKKGDKGIDLLQEILQYLRDLRSVELSTRKMSNAALP